MTQPPNPKKAFGDKKPQLHLVPLSGMLAQWEAHFDGALKYTEVNWRKDPVEVMTYIDAAIRHIRLYENGEEYARDTKVKNLGAVMACCAILIDAELHGTLIDNRTHSPQSCDLLHGRGEEMVQHLRAAQAERDDAKLKATNPAYIVEQELKASTFELLKPTELETKLYSFTPIETCSDCTSKYDCQRVGVCFGDRPEKVTTKFTTCGKCDDINECGGAGRCFGR